jgi:hypothetical protein
MADTIKRFVAYEVNPVVVWEGNDESEQCEAFQTIADAEACAAKLEKQLGIDAEDEEGPKIIWSVYGRDNDGFAECIVDCDDEAHAHEILFKITGIKGKEGVVYYPAPGIFQLRVGGEYKDSAIVGVTRRVVRIYEERVTFDTAVRGEVTSRATISEEAFIGVSVCDDISPVPTLRKALIDMLAAVQPYTQDDAAGRPWLHQAHEALDETGGRA